MISDESSSITEVFLVLVSLGLLDIVRTCEEFPGEAGKDLLVLVELLASVETGTLTPLLGFWLIFFLFSDQ